MLFWLRLPQINIPDEENVSDDDNDESDKDGAVVVVKWDNGTDHDDTDHGDTHANNDVFAKWSPRNNGCSEPRMRAPGDLAPCNSQPPTMHSAACARVPASWGHAPAPSSWGHAPAP